jgi:hypothetical protein
VELRHLRFGYSFGNRVKLLRRTPEPKPISIGIAAPKGRLSSAAEKFWQCAKEAPAAKAKLESKAYTLLRLILSLAMREDKVLGAKPSNSAAPPFP